MAQHRIIELANIISANTATVDAYFTENGHPTPSLDVSAPAQLPIDADSAPHIEKARCAVIEAADELQALMKGPAELLAVGYTDYVGLQAVARFDIAKSFPVNEEASFADIAAKTGVDERNVRRLVRHAMAHNRCFVEPRKGIVAHNALTRLLAEEPRTKDYVAMGLDELWPAATRAVDALERWPGSEEPNQTGFSLANHTSKSMWEVYAEDGAREEKFGRGMSSLDKLKGYEPSLLLNGYPWADKQLIVDVGGSHGTIMINIARAFPHIKCIVQDLPDVIQEGKSKLPPDVAGRVDLAAHDFFTDQPVSGDVYYMRSILHNWSDKYSLRILRRLIPAMNKGARVLVHELVLPEPNTLPEADEKRIRHMDLAMLQLLNSYQRDAEEWKALFAAADRRYKFLGISRPPGAAQSLIEAAWEP